nr:MAG TPA: hypothetical protein [Caudoviricetes sp.]
MNNCEHMNNKVAAVVWNFVNRGQAVGDYSLSVCPFW